MDRTAWFGELTEMVARRSTCPRLHVGAIAVRDNRILATGYNGAPSGLPHCTHSVDDPCTTAMHAEANVISQAARFGISLVGSTIYCTHSPCPSCAGLMINTGISRVVFLTRYRDPVGESMMKEVGIECASL